MTSGFRLSTLVNQARYMFAKAKKAGLTETAQVNQLCLAYLKYKNRPEMSGIEFFQWLWNNRQDINTIISAGSHSYKQESREMLIPVHVFARLQQDRKKVPQFEMTKKELELMMKCRRFWENKEEGQAQDLRRDEWELIFDDEDSDDEEQ